MEPVFRNVTSAVMRLPARTNLVSSATTPATLVSCRNPRFEETQLARVPVVLQAVYLGMPLGESTEDLLANLDPGVGPSGWPVQ